ncbi:MAG: ATP-grasp domain-containing protein, partial [Alphaproteobacteria bacterium]|nr:ATP-grasp domain-containing protein [Alphaproteobacteria bacterium]
VDDLNKIIKKHNIDIIYHANSFVIDALYNKKNEINLPILLPSDKVIEITRSKKNTLNLLKDSLPLPHVYKKLEEVNQFPVFIKPDNGYGAQGAQKIDTPQELALVDFNKFVVQELLPGREYTIDCISDNEGKLLFSAGRERSRIRMATSMHAETVGIELDNFFTECAKKILQKIKISGAWFFQMKEDAFGNLKLLEIDVRIAGTMCYNRCRGINFPLLSLYLFFNLPINIIFNKTPIKLDRSLRNRYLFEYEYDKVYVDLDDTIIFHDQINTDLIKFLYQCLNQNKKIILLSKHLGNDKEKYLKQWRIFEIFDKIIWLNEEDIKSDYIEKSKSIYIDDSFSQRKDVADKLGIPTFDASMIECLLDERI